MLEQDNQLIYECYMEYTIQDITHKPINAIDERNEEVIQLNRPIRAMMIVLIRTIVIYAAAGSH